MPELPEVETIRRQLLPLYRGKTFQKVLVKSPVLLQNCDADFFSNALSGQKLNNLGRVGKFLILECDACYPVFHLGMSGIFLKDKSESKYPQHIHVEMQFDDGAMLYFQDMRKFGKIWLYKDYPELPTLGLDPINEELTIAQLAAFLEGRNTSIKQFLMNQKPIAGIGNIYASEILFDAAILPQRKADSLMDAEITRLHTAIHKILHAAIDRFGTTYDAYRTVNGESGRNQHFLKVYQRAGQPCVSCGSGILKKVMGNRSTFFCNNCQQ